MHQVSYPVPWYLDEVVERLIKRNWLDHRFDIEDLYNPANYRRNAEFDNTKYILSFDLNVYQFILNIKKKKIQKKIIGMQLLCWSFVK
jgi:hypothetical protein